MSSAAGSSGQVISLPQGGGALKGIGEKFSPDLHTGTGNFTVPIAIPPGRNGFQPQLSLVYSTGNGNGPFGLGWSLTVPGVARKTSKGVPQYKDGGNAFDPDRDVFILSGAEDLVPVPVAPDARYEGYVPRTEGLFARIWHHRTVQSTLDDYWSVESKDGLVSTYGTPRPATADPSWRDPAIIANPDNPTHVFAWKLTSTIDPFGNRIEYAYERELEQDGNHYWEQCYLEEIRYADYVDAQQRPRFLVHIRFNYETRTRSPPAPPTYYRPDPFSEYRAGFEIRTVRRCASIEIYTDSADDPGNEVLTRRYRLIYQDELPGAVLSAFPPNAVSLLTQITVEGHDGDKLESLPPLEFGYTPFDPNRRDLVAVTGSDLPARSLADRDLALVDVIGNGLPDILEMNGSARYWRNVGAGQFALPRDMASAPAGIGLANPGVQLLDANGDGRQDLLVVTEAIAGYYPMRFGGQWDERSFRRYEDAPSFALDDPEVRLVDLDGDGVTDAIRSGTSLECYFNDPAKGWGRTSRIERRSIDVFPDVDFSDPRVRWADMTGDGLQDVVLLYDGNVQYWPALGRGNWAKPIVMQHCPRFPYDYDAKRILLGDVDGDGAADLVYVDDAKVTLWLNRSGNGWSDPITIEGTPPVSDMDALRLTDLLGSGISGVLWSSDAGAPGRPQMWFLDFTGGIKPYLLNQMDNHMGALSRVDYAPSTRFYLQDEARPATRWKTPLPFPVQVVAKVAVIDALSGGKLTTEYRYHHGYWDGAEREFRGFGRVDQRDTEVLADYSAGTGFQAVQPEFFSPPTETRTWFHQGPIGDEFGDWYETDFTGEFWSEDPLALSRPDSITSFLNGLPRRVKRDALRTLRGRVLRRELYALDDSKLRDRPYTVTEFLHGVTSLPVGDPWPSSPDAWQTRVFFPHALAERTTQWERGSDPLTQFKFTGDYDRYGQPRTQISIAVPRGYDFRSVDAPKEPFLATYVMTSFAQRDDQRYIVDRVASGTAYEVARADRQRPGANGQSALLTLRDAIVAGTVQAEVFGQTLSFYDGLAFQGLLPLGTLGDYGALARTETLVLTDAIIASAYGGQAPPYLVQPGPPAWPSEYPQEFRDRLPALAGYVPHDGVNPACTPGLYAATEQRGYDFQSGSGSHGLITAKRDPLGHETSITYDSYALLPTSVTLPKDPKRPVSLTTTAAYDYRVMQPAQVTEPNGNRTAFSFTPLGLLQSTVTMGKAGQNEGDTLAAPGTRLVYDFRAFIDRAQPVSVRTIRRVHHVTETDVALPERDETIETVEYSDGFGRLLQTRTQAEDVTFGGPITPDIGLGADQSQPGSDAVGLQRASSQPPNVVVSGWQTCDNKGRVVEKYEPFFSVDWTYLARANAPPELFGVRAQMYFEARGRVVRTVNPDGSEQRVVYGVPGSLATPEAFAPTPWQTYTYDANDNAGRTDPSTSGDYSDHGNTPSSVAVDALGRTIDAVERNGPSPTTDCFHIRSTFDIRGNVLTVTDALGRVAFSYVYDLANRPLLVTQLDGGERRSVLDAAGNAVEKRDAKGALVLSSYDVLNRALRLWAQDAAGEVMTLRERIVCAESPDSPLTEPAAVSLNALGKVYRHYDEAGLLTMEQYDFKGNVLARVRQVINDDQILAAFSGARNRNWQVQAYRVEWSPPPGQSFDAYAATLLNPTLYRTSQQYDALNRVKSMLYPQDADGPGQEKELRPHYNRAGALEQVELSVTTYVERIAYDAKGQRLLVAYGNGIMTRHAYDPRTFRLLRLRSERYSLSPGTLRHHPTQPDLPLQDLAYGYDLVGNILGTEDRTPGSGVLNNPTALTDPALAPLLAAGDALVRAFSYDPLYRLLSATGRECRDIPAPRPWTDDQRCGWNSGKQGIANQDNAPNLTALYQESYAYDPAGNMVLLKHAYPGSATPPTWTREFGMGGLTPADWSQTWPVHVNTGDWASPPGNQLTHVGDNLPGTPQTHFFDADGNLTDETTSRHFEWDHSDRMRVFRNQTTGAPPSVHAHYLYDSAGQRVKKLVWKSNGKQVETTVWIDGLFEHHELKDGQGKTKGKNDTLHVMDDRQRIATIRVGKAFPKDVAPAVRYQLGDHLGSSNVVVDDGGKWINREEYFPYGETSFGSFAFKRYRFTGKERDEESGLCYHGARYYAPWVGRWVSCDPAGPIDGPNLCRYAQASPVSLNDPSGTQGEPTSATQSNPPSITPEMFDPNPFVDDALRRVGSHFLHDADNIVSEADQAFKEGFVAASDPTTAHISDLLERSLPSQSTLRQLGFSDEQIESISKFVEMHDQYLRNSYHFGLLVRIAFEAAGAAGGEDVEGLEKIAELAESNALRQSAWSEVTRSLPVEAGTEAARPRTYFPPRALGEMPQAFGNRAHQEGVPAYLGAAYPDQSYRATLRTGQTGVDVPQPPPGMNARAAEMKPIWQREYSHKTQVAKWGMEVQEVRFLYYDEAGHVFEGVKQPEWSGLTKGRLR